MKFMDYLERCAYHELKEFQIVDFIKLYAEVAKTFQDWHLCHYCGKKRKYYFHSFDIDSPRKKIDHLKLCSYDCLRKFIAEKREMPLILNHGRKPQKDLALILRELTLQEFQKLKNFPFQQVIGKIIEQKRKEKACDYCKKNRWHIGFKIGKDYHKKIWRGDHPKDFRFRSFCSTDCLENYFTNKEDRELQQYEKR